MKTINPPAYILIEALRSRAGDIPQAAGEPPCAESRLLYDAADAIERMTEEKAALLSLVADMGEVASAAGFYARQAEDAAKEAGKRAAYINAKAMNCFDPSYRKEDFA